MNGYVTIAMDADLARKMQSALRRRNIVSSWRRRHGHLLIYLPSTMTADQVRELVDKLKEGK